MEKLLYYNSLPYLVNDQIEIIECFSWSVAMPITEQDMTDAIINLNAKSGLQWKLGCSYGNPPIYYDGVVSGQNYQEGEANFKKQLLDAGIEFNPKVYGTTKGGPARVFANFTHPLEIMAMANNIFFLPPPLGVLEKKQIADMLSEQTGFTWQTSEEGVFCQTRISATEYGQGECDFKRIIKEKGIEFEPKIRGTLRGSHLNGGGVGIWAVFDHPLELYALLKLSSRPIPKQQSYILKDPKDDNIVTKVFNYRDVRGSGYKIEGANWNGQSCSIIIYDTGLVVNGFDGTKNLGLVGLQMYQQKVAIFEHFRVIEPRVTTITSSCTKDESLKPPLINNSRAAAVRKPLPSSQSSISTNLPEENTSLFQSYIKACKKTEDFLIAHSGCCNFMNLKDDSSFKFFGNSFTKNNLLGRMAGVVTGPIALALCALIELQQSIVCLLKSLFEAVTLDFSSAEESFIEGAACLAGTVLYAIATALNPIINLMDLAVGAINTVSPNTLSMG